MEDRTKRSLPNFRRRGRRQTQITPFECQASNSPDRPTDPAADKPLELGERMLMLRQALASLPSDQAKLIRLARLKGLKAEQIATMVGKPSAQAVRAALCRAMKDLRAALQRQGYFDQVSV